MNDFNATAKKTRFAVFADYTANYKNYVDNAVLSGTAMLLHRLEDAAVDETPFEAHQQGRFKNICLDYLETQGFHCVPDGTGRSPSAIGDLKNAAEKHMFLDVCNQVFKRQFISINMKHLWQSQGYKSNLTGIPSGDPGRPWDDLDLGVPKLEADIPLNFLISKLNYTSNLNGRIPEYDIPAELEKIAGIEDGGPLEVIDLKDNKREFELLKAGLGYRATDTFLQSEHGADTVLEWVARVGQRTEIALANLALAEAAEGLTAVDVTFDDWDGVWEIITGQKNGKMLDAVFGDSHTVRDYMKGISSIQKGGVRFGDPIGNTAISMLVPQVTLLNTVSRPLYSGIVDPTEINGLAAAQLLGIDSQNTLGMLLYSGGDYDREDFDVQSGVERRFLATRYAFYRRTDAPRALFT